MKFLKSKKSKRSKSYKMLFLAMCLVCINGLNSKAEDINCRDLGSTKEEICFNISNKVQSNTWVVASIDTFSDSLSAINVANKYNGKLILINESMLTDINKFEGKPSTIYILGGENSISKKIEDTLKDKICSNITRISGENRYETNEESLKECGYNQFIAVSGEKYPDAMSASNLLTLNNELGIKLEKKETKEITNCYYTVGGEDSLETNSGIRISGYDRYETNKLVNFRIGDKENVYASGENFVEPLISYNLVKHENKKIVLTKDKTYNKKSSVFKKYVANAKEDYEKIFKDARSNYLKPIIIYENKDLDLTEEYEGEVHNNACRIKIINKGGKVINGKLYKEKEVHFIEWANVYEDMEIDSQKLEKADKEIEKMLKNSNAKNKPNDKEKVKAWLLELFANTSYDVFAISQSNNEKYDAYFNASTVYSVPLNKHGMCVSFTATTHRALDLLGIENYVTETTAYDNDVRHSLIRAKLDGKWSTIETTAEGPTKGSMVEFLKNDPVMLNGYINKDITVMDKVEKDKAQGYCILVDKEREK